MQKAGYEEAEARKIALAVKVEDLGKPGPGVVSGTPRPVRCI